MFLNLLFDNPILAVILIIALIFSLVMHELGHGYVALWNGDRTAQVNGRLSLNPLKHLDPVGFFMMAVVGFGYAKPVPVNPMNFRKPRAGLFAVSIAGVTVNIILAFLSCGVSVIILKFSGGQTFFRYLYTFFYYLSVYNLFLCFFNLLPLFPLDGFHVIESLCKRNNRFLTFMRRYSMYILIVLIALGVIVDRFNINNGWWQYVDILGTYLNFFATNIFKGLEWFWRLIFRV